MEEQAFAGIDVLASALRRGETTAVQLAEASLERVDRLDPALGAIVRTTGDRAMAEAHAADERLAADLEAPLLCGIPYAVKDIFDVAGEITGGGSPVLADNRAERDSAAVARLAAAGMVLVAKTRTSPFACEITGLNHSEGAPRNPWIAEPHVAGGSSSGSAVAVAAGMVPVALGSDTAGSARVPAAHCGVTGHKTSLGQVSRAGVLPLSESLDTVGALTRSARDAAHIFAALRGHDPADGSTVRATTPEPVSPGLDGLRIVIAEGALFEGVDSGIDAAVRAAADSFHDLGATVENREIPIFAEVGALEERWWLISGEAWRNVGATLEAWGEGRDSLTDWIYSGAKVNDADLETAWKHQRRLQAQFLAVSEGVDALIVPTTQMTARPIEVVEADYQTHVDAYIHNTISGNFLNLCGLSLPCGLDHAGRPIGMLLYAPPFADDRLLAIGAAWQEAMPFANRYPSLQY